MQDPYLKGFWEVKLLTLI